MMATLIVRRGMARQYYDYLNVATAANGDELIVDRRLGERRPGSHPGAIEPGRPDRRGPLPQTWMRDDVIVVDR